MYNHIKFLLLLILLNFVTECRHNFINKVSQPSSNTRNAKRTEKLIKGSLKTETFTEDTKPSLINP